MSETNFVRLSKALTLGAMAGVGVELTGADVEALVRTITGMGEEIKTLNARIAELEAAQRWIPVSERLPEEGEGVVVAVEGGFVYPDTFDCVSEGILHFYDSCNVTHWMPLPEPPEMAEDAWRALVRRACE